jgi:hypothetical protein
MIVERLPSVSCSFCSSVSPSIRGMLMSVTTKIHVVVRLERGQGLDTIVGEQKNDVASADLVPKLLLDKLFQVRLIVDN